MCNLLLLTITNTKYKFALGSTNDFIELFIQLHFLTDLSKISLVNEIDCIKSPIFISMLIVYLNLPQPNNISYTHILVFNEVFQ